MVVSGSSVRANAIPKFQLALANNIPKEGNVFIFNTLQYAVLVVTGFVCLIHSIMLLHLLLGRILLRREIFSSSFVRLSKQPPEPRLISNHFLGFCSVVGELGMKQPGLISTWKQPKESKSTKELGPPFPILITCGLWAVTSWASAAWWAGWA